MASSFIEETIFLSMGLGWDRAVRDKETRREISSSWRIQMGFD